MDETARRPGGLTALAVLNFVFAGFGALGLLGIAAALGMAAQDAATAERLKDVPQGLLYTALIVLAADVFLLIASGVGYLKLKRFGRTLGTIYGVLALVMTVIELTTFHTPFGIGTIIGLTYPLLTLLLVNTTFAGDLVH